MDNVLTHSDKELGTVITQYDPKKHILSFLIADDGIGVKASLTENEKYKTLSEPEALKICIDDVVTDGKGMGFGLIQPLGLIAKQICYWKYVPVATQCKLKMGK